MVFWLPVAIQRMIAVAVKRGMPLSFPRCSGEDEKDGLGWMKP